MGLELLGLCCSRETGIRFLLISDLLKHKVKKLFIKAKKLKNKKSCLLNNSDVSFIHLRKRSENLEVQRFIFPYNNVHCRFGHDKHDRKIFQIVINE